MSTRRDDCFHVLKVVRRIVDETHESIEAAAETERDRALVDEWRDGIAVARLHSTCHLLISERETLAKALERIGVALDQVGIEPRTRNLGPGARGAPTKGGA